MNRFEKLFQDIQQQIDNSDPSHDFLHVTRVLNTCLKIAENEKADLEILKPAALLHDIVNVPKNHPDRAKASEMAAEKAADLLKAYDYTEAEIQKIASVVLEHSFSRGLKPTSIESAILQDSDKLDGLGAIGVMRNMSVGTKMGAAFFHKEDPFGEKRELNDKIYSIDHFKVKLFKLEGLMNTEYGKTEARRRTQYMQGFLEQLQSEL